VRKLLELYATTGDEEAFGALYRAEIVPGRVKPTGLITYTLAKSFYQQEDLAQAASYFAQVPSANAWYGRARYFMGTIGVQTGDPDAARAACDGVVGLSMGGDVARAVHDPALLARGRIASQAGDYPAANEYYNRIDADSKYQPDKLYEM